MTGLILLPHFTRSLLARAFFIWLVLRGFVTVGSLSMSAMFDLPVPGHPLQLTARAVILLLAFVTATGWVYARRRNEHHFLLCLGYSQAHLLATLLLPAALMETAIVICVALVSS